MTELDDILPPLPGQRLQRGLARALRDMNFACLEEMPLASGLRADLMAIGPKGEVWIVECKSSLIDFRSDHKWSGYLEYCDRFFWGVGADFPHEILPQDHGLILGDAWAGEIIRLGALTPLAGARRKALTLSFARLAAARLQLLRDPTFGQSRLG